MKICTSRNIATDLAIQTNKKKEKKPFEEVVPAYLDDFQDVFEKVDFDELPESHPWDHAIELLPGTEDQLDCKSYPLNAGKQEELDKFLKEQLRTGQIHPSKSPMASPFFFIKKKDGKL
jgi:hypothetical protein